MKPIFLIVIVISVSFFCVKADDDPSPDQINGEWKKFQKSNNKNYLNSGEASTRQKIFSDNYKNAKKVNKQQKSFILGVTQFSDLSPKQFRETNLGVSIPSDLPQTIPPPARLLQTLTAVNWSSKTSPVKNQGSCGSCWIFAAVGVIEANYLQRVVPQSVILSEQRLVDCYKRSNKGVYTQTIGTVGKGCGGGWPFYALQWIQAFKIDLQSSYPYTHKNQACKGPIGTQYSIGVPRQSANNCASINLALMLRPVAVALAANILQTYRSGVITASACSGDPINHAVLLMESDARTYWRLKNSWGIGWGESGFFRLAYGNTCGMCANSASWVE